MLVVGVDEDVDDDALAVDASDALSVADVEACVVVVDVVDLVAAVDVAAVEADVGATDGAATVIELYAMSLRQVAMVVLLRLRSTTRICKYCTQVCLSTLHTHTHTHTQKKKTNTNTNTNKQTNKRF